MIQNFVLPLAAFAFVTSITPGPNNLMLMASGANFGFRRTIPHMLGISLGFSFMAFLMGIGLAELFVAFPWLRSVLTVVSIVYLLWLAWKIARAAPPEPGAAKGKPMTFLQAAAFQWVNPKAWAMALTAVTIYARGNTALDIFTVAAILGAVNLPSICTWVLLGQGMQRILTDQRRLIVFNWTMALLLVGSLYPVLI